MSDDTVTIKDNSTGKEVTLPIHTPTAGPKVIDIGSLYKELGYFTYDPGFMSTASCSSAITFLDGGEGVLQYRGYPIDQLAEHSSYLEVCYLLLNNRLPKKDELDATGYSGVELEIAGNNEVYNIHIRTAGLWLPWQSYRFTFQADPEWKTLRFPFTKIVPYKTSQHFQQHRLMRIGLVGIGRDFQADLCLAAIKLYKE